MQPLNPTLYRRLRRLFPQVVVSKAGEQMVGQHYMINDRKRFFALMTGEYYRVSCPFCRFRAADDTRLRLYISYRWGVPDESGERYWWAATCFNENCLDNPYTLEQLRFKVYSNIGAPATQDIVASPAVYADPGPCSWPGDCLPLTKLSESHQAIQFLRDRNFEPGFLSEKYDVRYCVYAEPRYAPAVGRIIIPVYSDGQLVTWQGRYPGQADWRYTSKYYNCPDRPKRFFLYGMQYTQPVGPLVLVEGPLDVWRMGDDSVGLMGKTVSEFQMRIIRKSGKLPVVMLDDDAQRNAQVVYDQLAKHDYAVKVQLGSGSPANFTQEECWFKVSQSIEALAKQQGWI